MPGFRNGNPKYVSHSNQTRRYVEAQLMNEDTAEPVKDIVCPVQMRPPHPLLDKARLHGTTTHADYLQRLQDDIHTNHHTLASDTNLLSQHHDPVVVILAYI